MSLSHRYADFGTIAPSGTQGAMSGTDAFEDIKLEAFENGYQAGWDDAVKAHASEQSKMSADLAQNFQDLSFTYHEAHAKLTTAMTPLLEQMVNKLLPTLARQSLGGHVLEQLTKLAQKQCETAIEIAVSAENCDALEALLSDQTDMPFDVVTEPALTGGQVYIRAGKSECEINLDAVIDGISEAMTAFFYETKKDPIHE